MFNPSSQIFPKLNEFNKIAYQSDTLPIQQRDTTMFYQILKRALSYNLRLLGHYNTRKSALSSFTYSIVPIDSAQQSKADEAKSRLNSAIVTLLDNQLKTVLYGSLLVRLSVQNSTLGNKILIDKVFENTEYDYDNNIVYIYHPQGKRKGYTTLDTSSTNDYLFDYIEFPHKGGLLRGIVFNEILRIDSLLEFGNYLRKLKGLLQIINKGGTDEEQLAAEQAAANAINDNFFISSDAIEMKLNQLTAASSSAFKDFLEEMNNSIAISMLGNANTSELPRYAGSRAALQVQKLLSADIFYSDMIRVENLINKLLLLDYRLNYNAQAQLNDLPYNFYFNLSEEQDIEKNANAIRTVIDFLPLKKEEVYAKLGFSMPESNDEIFKGFST